MSSAAPLDVLLAVVVGNLGGGAVNLPNLKAGEPLVATAGAERGVHVLNADRWSVVKRWPAAIKFEVSFF